MYPLITATKDLVFAEAPKLVYWELTRACDLACKHCRAEAIAERDPWELSTEEIKALLAELRTFGDPPPQLVLTGGDPLKRPDFFDLVRYGRSIGLPVSVAPSVTPLLTEDAISAFAAHGVESMSLSIDGATAESHDRFRGVAGCFDATIRAVHVVRAAGLPLQVNTLVTSDTMTELPAVFGLLKDLGIMRWSLFYLIGTGRGRALREIGAIEAETLHHWLYDLSKTAPFAIKATEAPHFRRVAYLRMLAEGQDGVSIRRTPIGRGFGIRDGNGIMFISHTGDVYPSGFLPVVTGNVRRQSPVALYRHAEVFTRIRDVEQYAGKCGLCEFHWICGGSRARAFAATGDFLGSDPLCVYTPQPLSGTTAGDCVPADGKAGQEKPGPEGGFAGPAEPICPCFRRAPADWLYPVTGYCLGRLNGKLMIPSIAEYRDLCTTEHFQSCQNYRSALQSTGDKERDARHGS